jgi:acetyl-CoA carboxylase carboxyl transferase subunit beta
VSEAVITGKADIGGNAVTIGIMDFGFLGGSMGSVVGERIKRAVDLSIEEKRPLILFSASGGARMQEGIISLMQMAKTVSSINRLRETKIPYFCIITNPTTAGVSASFVTIADIIIAETKTFFCFTGPRVIEQTIKKKIPDDFGLAERNLSNGHIDIIVDRKDLRTLIIKLLGLFL